MEVIELNHQFYQWILSNQIIWSINLQIKNSRMITMAIDRFKILHLEISLVRVDKQERWINLTKMMNMMRLYK